MIFGQYHFKFVFFMGLDPTGARQGVYPFTVGHFFKWCLSRATSGPLGPLVYGPSSIRGRIRGHNILHWKSMGKWKKAFYLLIIMYFYICMTYLTLFHCSKAGLCVWRGFLFIKGQKGALDGEICINVKKSSSPKLLTRIHSNYITMVLGWCSFKFVFFMGPYAIGAG